MTHNKLIKDNAALETSPSDQVPCPVCDRNFNKHEIEQHVNKCIFLNTASTNKRSSSNFENVSSQKKVKIENSSSSNSKETPSLKQKPVKEENQKVHEYNKNIPLAEIMRPKSLSDFVGQVESFGAGSMLHAMLSSKKIPNMILWGPPGCGKTSISNVIANICKEDKNLRFIKMSAVMSGINDVKEIVKVAKNEAQFKRQTVLFMDEIHRFNKLQQDTFLPHVENGTITLIGATTENPSFSLNNALLSRCRVVVLSKLTVADVCTILEKACIRYRLATVVGTIDDSHKIGSQTNTCIIEKKSIEWLSEVCDGDARVALGALELALAAARAAHASQAGPVVVSLDDLKQGIKRTHMLYDRNGEEHYNIISAIHKSIRASDDNAALYWTTRALHGGEDPLFIARRLIRAACEDIGLGDPSCLADAVACLQGCQHIGMPECDVLLAQCAVRLARANKSHEVYHAMRRVQKSLSEAKGALPSVPLHLRNAPTKLMKDLGYSKGYNMRHRDESGLTYMPEGMENVNFFV